MTRSTVTVEINKEIFERLQSLAIPLVDDLGSVMSRLIDHWEKTPSKEGKNANQSKSWWTSARGERLPIGTELRARYNGEEFKGKVLGSGIFFGDETFNSPSAAAIAAKKKNFTELTNAGASTNGWKFWEYSDEKSKSWRSVSDFKAGSK